MKTAVPLFIIIVLIPFYSCNKQSSETKGAQSTTIEIAIQENSQLFIDGVGTNIDDLSKIATNRIDELVKDGVNINDVIVSIKSDKTVAMGMISDIQTLLRDLDLKKISYSRI